MRVTRITLDHELGLIELKTGPGGDGDYVLLPLEVKEAFLRYIKLAEEEDAYPEPPYSGIGETAEEARGDESLYREARDILRAPGGWSVPKDQIPGWPFNRPSDLLTPKRGGIKYERSPELQKMHDLVDDTVPPVVTPEPEGDKPVHNPDQYAITDVNGYVITALPNDRDNYTYHPGEGRWLPNPLPVYADEHGRGYRLKSPHIPHWSYDIQKYELHRVPTLALAAAKRAGKDTTNTDVAVIIKEMS